MNRPLYILIAIVTLMVFSCRKDSFITGSGAITAVSADSLHFDTLFTSTGSVTQAFKIFNRNDRKLMLSNISLAGGSGSSFRINADGFEGPEVNNIEMEANDSVYVFVTVRIDPGAATLPYIVQDSIRISFNGNERWVFLDAWGRNANFLRSATITSNTTWTNDKPYVILGGVQVAEHVVLTIEKGTQIFLHANAPLLVEGTLKVNGEKTDSMEVVFTGDRLDDPYVDYPGAWPGIYFGENSMDNVLKHVIVKNAYQGIVAEKPSVNGKPKLTLDRCIISNCYDAGIIAVNTSLDAVNCLIYNCGKNIQLLKGGDYSLLHCTSAAYSNTFVSHKQPSLTVTNFIGQGSTLETAPLKASLRNSIFWGDDGIVDDEVVVLKEQGTGVFEVDFRNSLWKVTTLPDNITLSGMVANADPLFLNIDTRNNAYDFHINEMSAAAGIGMMTDVDTDLDDNSRDVNFPDAGAYEATF